MKLNPDQANTANIRRKYATDEKFREVWAAKERAMGFRLCEQYDYDQGVSLWPPDKEKFPVERQTRFLKSCADSGRALRPPEAVQRYEYGNASTRPKSRLTQIVTRRPQTAMGRINPAEDPAPPVYSPFGWGDPAPNPQAEPLDYQLVPSPKKTAPFFYTYGRGLGTHAQEPILRAPQSLAYRQAPATYYDKPDLVKQWHIDGVPNKSFYLRRPHTSSGIRSTNAHSARTRYTNRELARTSAFVRDDHFVDKKNFAHRDKIREEEDKICPGWNDWMFADRYTEPQQHAMAILLAIQHRARRMKQRIKDIFAIYCDRRDGGVTGVLPLEHFLYALQEKRIVPWQSLTLEHLARACLEFDPEFRGHVCLEQIRRVLARLPKDALHRLRRCSQEGERLAASSTPACEVALQAGRETGSGTPGAATSSSLFGRANNVTTVVRGDSTTVLDVEFDRASSKLPRSATSMRRSKSAPRIMSWRDFVVEEPILSPSQKNVGSPKHHGGMSPRMDRSALDPAEIEAMRLLHGAPLLPQGQYLRSTDSYHIADG